MRADEKLFQFLGPLATREGATVIMPRAGHEPVFDYAMKDVISAVRHFPVDISTPDPLHSQYPFAERGARGRWMLIWIPED